MEDAANPHRGRVTGATGLTRNRVMRLWLIDAGYLFNAARSVESIFHVQRERSIRSATNNKRESMLQ